MVSSDLTLQEAYKVMFTQYPDIVKVADVCEMLGVGRKKIYELIRSKQLHTIANGKGYNITKLSVIAFLLG